MDHMAEEETIEEQEKKTMPVFMEGIDEENVTQEIWKSLNQLYAYVSNLVNYKYHLLLYRLVKQGVKMKDLTAATGYTRQHIHDVITQFEEREVQRAHEKA